jgi:hypothetical protein
VPDDAGDLNTALLEQFVNQLSFTSGLGCDGNVYNFAATWSLAWQYFGNELWYWNHVLLYWMRTDGLQYFPKTGQYWSFCTGLRWDHINSVWV